MWTSGQQQWPWTVQGDLLAAAVAAWVIDASEAAVAAAVAAQQHQEHDARYGRTSRGPSTSVEGTLTATVVAEKRVQVDVAAAGTGGLVAVVVGRSQGAALFLPSAWVWVHASDMVMWIACESVEHR